MVDRTEHRSAAEAKRISGSGAAAPSLLGDGPFGALLIGATTRAYSSGERVQRPDVVDDLYVVLEGEVGLLSRDAPGTLHASVGPGGALELDTLLGSAQDWRYHWICKTPVRLARLPRTALNEFARTQPTYFRYLERIASHPELASIASNLRLFGASEAHVRALIAALVRTEIVSRIDLRLGSPHLGIVQLGQVDVEVWADGEQRVLAHYGRGEPFTLGHSDDLSFEPAVDTVVWLLDFEVWSTLDDADQQSISLFSKFADPLTRLPTLGSAVEESVAPQLDAPSSKKREPDHDSEPEISHFVASQRALRRLHLRRRPFVQQHDEMDCGAACMSMVARFFGRRIDVPTFRSLVHVTRDGASLFSLKKAAQHVGFEAIGIKGSYRDLSTYLVPFIALNEYHFVVVYRVSDEQVVLGDPAVGVVAMTAEEFKRQWSGIALLLKPTPALARFPQSKASYGKYLQILRGNRKHLFEAVLASCLLFVFGLASPLFMQFLLDKVLPSQKRDLLDVAALALLAITVTSHVTEWTRSYLFTYVASRADAKFAALFLRKTFDLPLGFFAVRRVGAITARLSELGRIRSFMTEQTIGMLISALTALIYAVVLGLYHRYLLAIVLFTIPLTLLFVRVLGPALKRTLQEIFKVQSRSRGMAFEHFNGIEAIKSVNGMLAARWRWYANFEKLLMLRRRSANLVAWLTSVTCTLDGLTNVSVLAASVWLYMRHELSLGQVVAANALVASVAAPILGLAEQWESVAQVGVSFARIDDFVASAPEPSGDLAPTLSGRIEFQDVSFQYGSELSPMVLSNISMTIEAGETVAFVGHSGSGKTTIASMVNLLYPPTKGKIMLDGYDARSLTLSSLRGQVAMISQDNSMFSGSILENITLGDPKPSFERALAAAKAADAHGFIEQLPDKYATQLAEGGSGLSTGQRQRLNIARALYRDPAILIMDEATSSLDAVSERFILANYKKVGRKRTTIIIAHRLNTVMNADRIYVLDKGRIVESGTHRELTAARGHYYGLIQKQLASAS